MSTDTDTKISIHKPLPKSLRHSPPSFLSSYTVQSVSSLEASKIEAVNLLSRLEADNSILLSRIESLESSLQSLLSSISDECYQPGGKKDIARDAARECLNDLTYLDRLHTLANRNDYD